MKRSELLPTLDYATPTPAPQWPIVALLLTGAAGVVLSPSVACACWRGEYKTYLALVCSGLLILRTLIALFLGERGLGWIPYVVTAAAAFFVGPWLVETWL